MLNSAKFRKLALFWSKLLVWLVVLAGVVIVQSGALQPAAVEASINVAAAVNEPTIDKILPASGPVAGNTHVIITGTNFEGVIALTFGSVNALSFTVDSPTSLSAATPPGKAGPVRVVVLTADKAVAFDNGFTYAAPPATPTATPTVQVTTSPAVPATATIPVSETAAPAVTVPVTTTVAATVSPPSDSPTPGPAVVTNTPDPSILPTTITPAGSPTATITDTPTASPDQF